MRRNNRPIVLIGIALALLTFVFVLAVGNAIGNGGSSGTVPKEVAAVVAAVDIPLGTVVTKDMVKTQSVAAAARDATGFADASLVIGKTTRRNVVAGAQVVAADFGGSGLANIQVPKGLRAMAVQVDALSGVGNIIKAGDWVDVVLTLSEDAMPIAIPATGVVDWQLVQGYKPLTVKSPALLQAVQVLGTQDTTPTTTAAGATPAPNANTGNRLVILGVTSAQAEAITYAVAATGRVSLILRSPDDKDTVTTSGVILRTLFDTYGVVPPYQQRTLDVWVAR